MTNEEKTVILEGAKQAFFKAMLDGYAGGKNRKSFKTKTPDGYTVIIFEDGEFMVEDRYCTTPHSDKSTGTTTIFFRNVAVWWMSYGGHYPKKVIPFLKEALKQAYEKGEFYGGRGPGVSMGNGMLYTNNLAYGNFKKFRGVETIHKSSRIGKLLGFHEYFGMSML